MKTYILRDPQAVEPQKAKRAPRSVPARPRVPPRAPKPAADPVLFVGLDVHNDTIAVSLAPSDSPEVRRYGIIGGAHDDVLKLLKKLAAAHPGVTLKCCYEAGPRGYSETGRAVWLKQLPHPDLRAQVALLFAAMDHAVQTQRATLRLLVRLGQAFPEIERLATAPGLGKVGAHLFAAYIADPARFRDDSELIRYCRLGIRDRSSDGKPLGHEQLDRTGLGTLKAISYRAWLQAMKRRDSRVYEFFRWSKANTGSATHARLNTQRKLIRAWWTLWRKGKEWDETKFFPDAK